mmetsp:Transcript_17840/g.37572  ORF Transcript_17840/g.37572 Transcript_17840/m.37572 type:complete len:480 (-) Transcript_17840:217-1656(-)
MIFLRQAAQTVVRRAAFATTVGTARPSAFINATASLATMAGSAATSPSPAASPAAFRSSGMTCRGFADAAAATEQGERSSPWKNFPMAPPDPIIGLTEAYLNDDFPQKVNVGVGAYRCDQGNPFVLPVVREAEQELIKEELDHEYSGIAGCPNFVNLALRFVYGEDCTPLKEKRIAGVQTLSGTGGLRVFGEVLAQFGHKHIYVPNPTWGNHIPIFTNAGLEVKKYRYYDNATCSLDFDGLIEDMKGMPEGTCVLLHACAHNPTGMDPTPEQWKEISKVAMEQNLLPFFDCAYQGFASGDARKDAAAVRMFVEDGHKIALVQSFSKNFGLYGQRIGALSVVADSPEEALRVQSQLKVHIRPSYSNPPRHGARIVGKILASEEKTNDFVEQCMGMAQRINSMRSKLREALESLGSTRSWDHITKQIGMFAYSGMSKEEVTALREKHHIYCTLDGRISMAGVTSNNVEYIARAIYDVTEGK